MSRITEIKRCSNWLSTCLKLGWGKDQLDFLEALWWKYHREENCPICEENGK